MSLEQQDELSATPFLRTWNNLDTDFSRSKELDKPSKPLFLRHRIILSKLILTWYNERMTPGLDNSNVS
jgi:hypothetical protein